MNIHRDRFRAWWNDLYNPWPERLAFISMCVLFAIAVIAIVIALSAIPQGR